MCIVKTEEKLFPLNDTNNCVKICKSESFKMIQLENECTYTYHRYVMFLLHYSIMTGM